MNCGVSGSFKPGWWYYLCAATRQTSKQSLRPFGLFRTCQPLAFDQKKLWVVLLLPRVENCFDHRSIRPVRCGLPGFLARVAALASVEFP
jgi:hypothetical protein